MAEATAGFIAHDLRVGVEGDEEGSPTPLLFCPSPGAWTEAAGMGVLKTSSVGNRAQKLALRTIRKPVQMFFCRRLLCRDPEREDGKDKVNAKPRGVEGASG